MPISFRETRSDEPNGLAGFLRFIEEEQGRGLRGALFLVNGFGEPVDFAFARTDIPAPVLWRPGDAARRAAALLAAALFQACPKTPALLLVLAAEVNPKVFIDDLVTETAMVRIEVASDEVRGNHPSGARVDASWVGKTPAVGSQAREIFDALSALGLLWEPFERAEAALDEAFRG